jgi:hypothetical protein
MAFAAIGSLTAGLVAPPLALAAQEAVPGPSDAISPVHCRLTAVTGIAIGPDGALYAAQMSTGNTETAPFYRPDAGNVVRQTGPDLFEEITTGLDYPVHLDFGPDGALYVATPGIGANGGEGSIVRIDLAAAPVAVGEVEATTVAC